MKKEKKSEIVIWEYGIGESMMPYFFEPIEAPYILVLSPLCKVNRVDRLKIENKDKLIKTVNTSWLC